MVVASMTGESVVVDWQLETDWRAESVSTILKRYPAIAAVDPRQVAGPLGVQPVERFEVKHGSVGLAFAMRSLRELPWSIVHRPAEPLVTA